MDVDRAWAALRDVGNAHRLFAPVLTDARFEGDVRAVTFANGMVATERILDVDSGQRRVAYTVLDGPGLLFHHASMEVVPDGPGTCRFIWITDFLPDAAKPTLLPLIQSGASALRKNLEARGREP